MGWSYSILTYQLHDLVAIVEVATEHPEYSKHRVLLLRRSRTINLTAACLIYLLLLRRKQTSSTLIQFYCIRMVISF